MQNQTRIYFDNAATTPLSQTALNAMEPFWASTFGNASSPYAVSRNARSALDAARSQVAALIGAHADEIVWTSGGTESDNWALLGVALAHLETRGQILVSSIEHHAVLEAAQTVCDLGFGVELIPVDEEGRVEPQTVAQMLRSDTLLVSMMHVNNETGVVQPIGSVGKECRARGVLLHCDAVQAAGKMPLDVNESNVDLMSLSAHKLGGPKGVGALYIRRGTRMKPLLRGGAQERGRRAGTENVPAIVGFGAVAQQARENMEGNAAYLSSLHQRLEHGLTQLEGARINGSGTQRAPHITNVSLHGQRAELLALNLDLQGFAVGTGSACASGALEPSHVLAAMGRDRETARASLRISLGLQNTIAEVDEFLAALAKLLR